MNDAAIVERWLAKYRTILESGERPEPLAVFLYAGQEQPYLLQFTSGLTRFAAFTAAAAAVLGVRTARILTS